VRSMYVAGLCALTAIAAISSTPAPTFRFSPSIVSAGSIKWPASSPPVQISGGKNISNCNPDHIIANNFDYCTNTPVLL
jgi:hypothetical protein